MPGLLDRLDHHDRRLLQRWILSDGYSRSARAGWVVVTQLGSTISVVLAALLIPLLVLPDRADAWLPAAVLTISFLIAQLIKRLVQRQRPDEVSIIACPDRFSFPSGHATSSMAIGLGLGVLVPAVAPIALALALLAGASRVVLGVHYPGDVVAGQLIAVATTAALHGVL